MQFCKCQEAKLHEIHELDKFPGFCFVLLFGNPMGVGKGQHESELNILYQLRDAVKCGRGCIYGFKKVVSLSPTFEFHIPTEHASYRWCKIFFKSDKICQFRRCFHEAGEQQESVVIQHFWLSKLLTEAPLINTNM